MQFKDLFSGHATDYARFRPGYPTKLFAWLAGVAPGHDLAVDVGAGNGQAASELAQRFAQVIAIEPSSEQIASGSPATGVSFRQGSAEALGLDDHVADLIVAAQAFHWFKHDAFFAEVRRVLRPAGILAVWCYGLATISPEIDPLVLELYDTRVGRYWEPERKLVETGYRDIEIPFEEIQTPTFEMRLNWTFEQLMGYLGTWSALKRFIQVEGRNPIEDMLPRFDSAWGHRSERPVVWPVSVRAFRI
jgi:SAM-dependent methyltransferase